jgi:signal transduction histidine kinase
MKPPPWVLLEGPRGTTARYALAVVLVVAAALVFGWLTFISGSRFVTVYVIGAVLASWLGGFGPGLLYTALATLALLIFSFPPVGTLTLPTTPTDVTSLILFWLASALISVVGERVRASSAAARRLTNRLTGERDRLRQVLDILPVAVDLADAATGQYTLSNEASRALLGTELAGQPVPVGDAPAQGSKRLNGDDLAATELPLQRALATGETVLGVQYTVLSPERGEVPVLVNAAPLRSLDGNTLLGAVSACQDISQLRTLERQKNHFLSVLSHDLQQPLTAILMQTQLLRRRLERTEGSLSREILDETLQRIERATLKLADQGRELLELVRSQDGEAPGVRLEPVDFAPLVSAVVAEHQQIYEGYTFRLHTNSDPLPVMLDPPRMQRALGNLLSNAVKYSSVGTVVSVRLRGPDDTDPWICLEVKDQGIGIPAADLPLVFEQFHRGSNVGTTIPGTGLGLAGVRQIIAEHGGTVNITSTEGRGTTVVVRLPTAPMQPPSKDGAIA